MLLPVPGDHDEALGTRLNGPWWAYLAFVPIGLRGGLRDGSVWWTVGGVLLAIIGLGLAVMRYRATH